MLVPIDQIVVQKRVRRDLGDLSALMESMRLHGLINPILVSKEKILIAGERRLESARRLGWRAVEVHMVEGDDELDCLEVEVDENLHRKELLPDELQEAFRRISRLRNPTFWQKIWRLLRRAWLSIFPRRRPE